MLGVRLTVPIACWRKGHARELLESEPVPPPATCYGALLSYVGEHDRARHRGVRITSAIGASPGRSLVVRTTWRVKDSRKAQGHGENAKPDFQQLLIGSEVVIWLDSQAESTTPFLEERVRLAFANPGSVERSGGWSLGESTHLINDAWLLDSAPEGTWTVFIANPQGAITLPVWVDHVGTAGTRYAVGDLRPLDRAPIPAELPTIG